jgi:hydrogenase nickel incorporation protein HypB
LKRATPNLRQITAGTICHLDAQMVELALESWRLNKIDFLFIENVGNLVCPSSYDLGRACASFCSLPQGVKISR